MNSWTLLSASLRPEFNLYWLTALLFFSFVLQAVIKQNNSVFFTVFKSFFNFRYFKQALREESNSSRIFSKVFLFNSFIIIAIALNYFVENLFLSQYVKKGFVSFLIVFLAVIGWYVLNFSIKIVIAKVSDVPILAREAERYYQYFFQVLGIMLLPGVLGLYFFPKVIFQVDTVIASEIYIQVIVALLLLNKLIQSIFQSFELKISWHYIFLYICTLEILPLCVGFQLLVS